MPCSIPNSISSLSFFVIAGKFTSTPGKFTPFLDDTLPEFSTLVIISLPDTSTTFNDTRPSSINTVSPTFKSSAISLYDTVHLSLFPIHSSIVMTNLSPSTRSIGSSKSPVLISGPLVSNKIATGMFNSSLILFVRSILSLCSSCEPCEKLNLHTFNPFNTNSLKISSESVAGPIVQTIFVFLFIITTLLINHLQYCYLHLYFCDLYKLHPPISFTENNYIDSIFAISYVSTSNFLGIESASFISISIILLSLIRSEEHTSELQSRQYL